MSRRAMSHRFRMLEGDLGAVLFLSASAAGPAKAAELDGELLACCASPAERMRRAAQLSARTPEGLRAKASLALRDLSGVAADFPLVASVLRDIVGRAA